MIMYFSLKATRMNQLLSVLFFFTLLCFLGKGVLTELGVFKIITSEQIICTKHKSIEHQLTISTTYFKVILNVKLSYGKENLKVIYFT